MVQHVYPRIMKAEEFKAYRKSAIEKYAEELIKSELETKENAFAFSEKEFDRLLPKDGNTEDNCIFIMQNDSNDDVGIIWFCLRELFSEKVSFICDILVYEQHQKKGYGSGILRYFEEEMKRKNVNKLGLNVFKNNEKAIALYYKEGFTVQEEAPDNMYMVKEI